MWISEKDLQQRIEKEKKDAAEQAVQKYKNEELHLEKEMVRRKLSKQMDEQDIQWRKRLNLAQLQSYLDGAVDGGAIDLQSVHPAISYAYASDIILDYEGERDPACLQSSETFLRLMKIIGYKPESELTVSDKMKFASLESEEEQACSKMLSLALEVIKNNQPLSEDLVIGLLETINDYKAKPINVLHFLFAHEAKRKEKTYVRDAYVVKALNLHGFKPASELQDKDYLKFDGNEEAQQVLMLVGKALDSYKNGEAIDPMTLSFIEAACEGTKAEISKKPRLSNPAWMYEAKVEKEQSEQSSPKILKKPLPPSLSRKPG